MTRACERFRKPHHKVQGGFMDAVKNDDIDPQGYGIDLERCVRRMGYKNGEQTVILQATPDCSDAEWQRLREAIVACANVMKRRSC
jgi:hypothetical protein